MKLLRLFRLVAIIAGVAEASNAQSEGTLRESIVRLLTDADFRWTLHCEQNNWPPGQRVTFRGWTGTEGYTVVERSEILSGGLGHNTDLPARIVFKDEQGVAEIQWNWLSPREVAERSGGSRLPVVLDLVGKLGATQTPRREAFDLPRPERVLPALLDHLVELRSEDNALIASLGSRVAMMLLNSGCARAQVTYQTDHSATRIPQWLPGNEYASADGEVRFWVVDGALVKYELQLSARPKRGAPPNTLTAVTIVTLIDEMNVEIEVPQPAKDALDAQRTGLRRRQER